MSLVERILIDVSPGERIIIDHLDFHTAPEFSGPELCEPLPSQTSHLAFVVVECCFTSTETVGLLGTGAQDVHLDFHTAPELCQLVVGQSLFMQDKTYVPLQ